MESCDAKNIPLLLSLLLAALLLQPVFAAGNPAAPAETEQAEPLDPRVEAMLAWALETAADDSHGYSQITYAGVNYKLSRIVVNGVQVEEGSFTKVMTDKQFTDVPGGNDEVQLYYSVAPAEG